MNFDLLRNTLNKIISSYVSDLCWLTADRLHGNCWCDSICVTNGATVAMMQRLYATGM